MDQVMCCRAAAHKGRTVSLDEPFWRALFDSGHPMNKDQVIGTLKDAQGKVQEHAGKTVGNPAQEAKGLVKQAEARLQKACGDVKEALKNSRHS
jgi:uncharacterized protein YjbJ (UPF0337 family)